MPVSVDASKTLIAGVSSLTWANRPSSANASGLYLFTDIGASGTLMRYAGGRWRPLAGQAQLASLGAAVTGIANSETIVLQTLIPAGAWQTNDTIRLWFAVTKSGTTDTSLMNIRVGTDGTTSDTAITAWSITLLTAVNRTYSAIADIKLASATSVVRPGSGFAAVGPTNVAEAAATVVSDVSTNPIYVSLTLRSSSTNDTTGITYGEIQLITP